MQTIMTAIESIRRSVTVPASCSRAFETLTQGMDRWWPATNSLCRGEQAYVTVEPWVGGRWFEVSVDGQRCDWGHVLVWEPPHRLVLAWQLQTFATKTTDDASCPTVWSFEVDFHTEVEFRFTAIGHRQTRVEVEHRNLDRFTHPEPAREYLDHDLGWPGLLTLFARAAQTP